ncbi:uncharacterized protein LOC141851633 [Brevipalpus obovatus]|uniref:uncharacterized protein LOC141851633 n=1 Tax=Brevipalpus obovatus TaxID=246614 RepID=UPI003D9FA84F
MMKAIETVFPTARIKGCLLHFTRAIWRNVLKLGLSSFHDNTCVVFIVRGLMGIVFLPMDQLGAGIEYLNSLMPSDEHPAYGPLLQLFSYFSGTWMRGRFPPSMWNCFRNFGIRTTTHIEGWHHRLNDKVKRKHPEIYLLIFHLKNEEETDKNRLTLYDGHRLRQPEKKYRDLNCRIMQYTSELESGQRPSHSFLHHVSCCVHEPIIA